MRRGARADGRRTRIRDDSDARIRRIYRSGSSAIKAGLSRNGSAPGGAQYLYDPGSIRPASCSNNNDKDYFSDREGPPDRREFAAERDDYHRPPNRGS